MQGIQASSGFQVRVWLNQFRYHPLEMNRQQKGRVKLSEQVVWLAQETTNEGPKQSECPYP